jgi:hypothetical protein
MKVLPRFKLGSAPAQAKISLCSFPFGAFLESFLMTDSFKKGPRLFSK